MNGETKAEAKLSYYINNEKHSKCFINYSPQAILKVLCALGSPQRKYPVFHIAGTNGKGSTAAYIHALLSNSGIKTGLFTSPHLIHAHERITIDTAIDDDAFSELIDSVDATATKCGVALTWFDMITAVAFLYFQENRLAAAVIECGLGGRLDSTNCVDPEVSVITELSLDHCHILGDTIEKIASEKAGIIKNDRPLVAATTNEIARTILCEHAKNKNAPTYLIGRDYSYASYKNAGLVSELAQAGEFQQNNFATALIAVLKSGFKPDNSAISQSSRLLIKGRCEIIHKSPLVIYDPAHNPAALQALIDHFKSTYRSEISVFISIMNDKDHDTMLSILKQNGCQIHYIVQSDPRQYKPQAAAFPLIDEHDHKKIVACLQSQGLNLFTGTFRMYSMVKSLPIE